VPDPEGRLGLGADPICVRADLCCVEFRSVGDSFNQAVAAGDAEESQDRRELSRGRRERARNPAANGRIPSEIAFLATYGVAPGLLLQAAAAAERCGVYADAALLGEGLVSEELYYRALAQVMRVPYFRGGLAIDETVDPERAIANGVALLAPNHLGHRVAAAPRGAGVRLLVAAAAAGRSHEGLVISSPQRFTAFIRARAGRRVAEAAAGVLERRDPELSARLGLTSPQIVAAVGLAGAVAAIGSLAPGAPAMALSAALWLIFGAWIVLRNLAVAAAGGAVAAPPLAEEDLPVYSIVAPLCREAGMVAKLIKSLDAIDYPRAKLDIKLVIERRDADTLAAIAALALPGRYDVIVAPPGRPATKPRALNVALPALRGDLVVVYDAEDEPDRDQLRLAASRFAADPSLDCLQARLTIDNAEDAWISKMFAVEYAALFDLVNPGLAALGLPIALGGTSNHFRTPLLRRVGGWDAWNVTEDADLGIRLAREGARVDALLSDTREEAPNDLLAWFRQRVRWQKGWMQTLIVHSRHPVKFVTGLGPARALAAAAMVAGAVFGGLFGPILAIEALWRLWLGDFNGANSWRIAGDVAIYTLMASGLMTIFVPALVATRRRGMKTLGGLWLSLPLYYLMISAASWAALLDLAIRPFHWAKTEHGRRRSATDASPG